MNEPEITLQRRIINYLGLGPKTDFVKERIDRSNMAGGFLISVIAVIVESYMIHRMYEYSKSPDYRPSDWIHWHMFSYIALLAVSIVFIVYVAYHWITRSKLSHGIMTGLVTLYTIVCCAFGVYISVTDHHDPYITFLNMTICSFCLFALNPIYAIVTAIISTELYSYYLELNTYVSHGSELNVEIIEIILVAVCIVRYNNNMRYAAGIEETERLNEKLYQLSFYDGLTGLLNRHAFDRDAADCAGNLFSVLMFDIDDFKSYNDRYGHSFGDRMLVCLGKSLQKAFGEGNCYRYGGDEFVIFLRNTSEEEALEMIEKWRQIYAEAETWEGANKPNCCYGYASGRPGNTRELMAMIDSADLMMRSSKKNKGLLG